MELVCNLISEFYIKCELREGNLHLAAKKRHVQGLRDEAEHLSKVYGYDQLRFVDSTEMGWMTQAQGMHGALLDQGARHLHPLKYAYGLAKAADLLGADIHEGSEVLGYTDNDGAQVQVDRQRQRQSALPGAGLQRLSGPSGAPHCRQHHAHQ